MELLVRKKHGLIQDDDWNRLCQLDTHMDDFKSKGNYEQGIQLMALGTSEFSFTKDTFDIDFVAAMYARILSNSLTLITPSFDPLGIMIEPTLCHINHSCEPNAYVIMNGSVAELRALKDVKKGEELFISYIDPSYPFTRRRGELKKRWFFDCECTKCKKGPTEQEDGFLLKAEDAPQKCKQFADSLLQREDSQELVAANYLGDSLDDRRMAALQGELFNAYEEQQKTDNVNHAITICKNAIEICQSSGLWPEHRQPLPALRDDLIVHLLSTQQYELAWAHSGKRYSRATPKLFPEPHHPVRVVQTWQMAMLAQYLASTGAEVAPGADMTIMTAFLIAKAHEMARKSHGWHSIFYKSVEAKYTALSKEMFEVNRNKPMQEVSGAFFDGIEKQEELLKDMGDLKI